MLYRIYGDCGSEVRSGVELFKPDALHLVGESFDWIFLLLQVSVSTLQHALNVVPLFILVLGYVGTEVHLITSTLLLLDHKDLTAIHFSDEDALSAEKVVVPFTIFVLLDLSHDEWQISILHLFCQ